MAISALRLVLRLEVERAVILFLQARRLRTITESVKARNLPSNDDMVAPSAVLIFALLAMLSPSVIACRMPPPRIPQVRPYGDRLNQNWRLGLPITIHHWTMRPFAFCHRSSGCTMYPGRLLHPSFPGFLGGLWYRVPWPRKVSTVLQDISKHFDSIIKFFSEKTLQHSPVATAGRLTCVLCHRGTWLCLFCDLIGRELAPAIDILERASC